MSVGIYNEMLNISRMYLTRKTTIETALWARLKRTEIVEQTNLLKMQYFLTTTKLRCYIITIQVIYIYIYIQSTFKCTIKSNHSAFSYLQVINKCVFHYNSAKILTWRLTIFSLMRTTSPFSVYANTELACIFGCIIIQVYGPRKHKPITTFLPTKILNLRKDDDDWCFTANFVHKRSQRWNALQICRRRDSNSGGSDLCSNALPTRPRRRPT